MIGRFVSFDNADVLGWSSALRFKVTIPLESHLRRGVLLKLASSGVKWNQTSAKHAKWSRKLRSGGHDPMDDDAVALGKRGGHELRCDGGGDLDCLWDDTIDLRLLSYSLHHVDFRVSMDGSSGPWRFTSDGQFNEILVPSEKVGGATGPVQYLNAFREVLSETGLVDLGYKRYRFTWDNKSMGQFCGGNAR
ncbi:hypothetical protein GH714_013872 [Hevea brasiliensis]|uniref:Uncharacterized protein n=1 Tax=Hevea brasiliensis TaxID=3981 RepID=A0A6A6K5J8_HEVBR|nr:hypothetical protein GH714_013872 [Hevea brasiliensis]